MWNQPCYNTPPNTGGQWIFIPGAAGGPTSPAPIPTGKSLKRMLRSLQKDRDALDEAIKELEINKKKGKKPEEEKKGLHIIHQSMIMMMTAVPIAVLDFILIRALHVAQ